VASAQSPRGGRAGIVGINVTPMVDVVLVLLVIMMVSANFIVAQSLKIELPKTSTSDGAASSLAAISVTKEGKLLFNGEPLEEADLGPRLRAARAGGADVSLVVSADQGALHGAVVHVIDVAKLEGVTKFAINVERSR
jgi:biopolymer transport protein ExbD